MLFTELYLRLHSFGDWSGFLRVVFGNFFADVIVGIIDSIGCGRSNKLLIAFSGDRLSHVEEGGLFEVIMIFILFEGMFAFDKEEIMGVARGVFFVGSGDGLGFDVFVVHGYLSDLGLILFRWKY